MSYLAAIGVTRGQEILAIASNFRRDNIDSIETTIHIFWFNILKNSLHVEIYTTIINYYHL
jgi:hypothetical protein